MNDTDLLIARLATGARPVTPLASPGRRTLRWVMVMAPLVAAMVLLHGPRPHLAQVMAQPAAALEWAGSVLTAVLAAFAAFQVSVPGRSPSWAWLPAPAAVLWLGGVGLGCASDAARMGVAAFAWEADVSECARAIVLASLPIALAMLWLVRYAASVRPTPTAALALLSAAALSSAAVGLIHAGETAWMVMVWHVGAVAVMSAAGIVFGRSVLAALSKLQLR